MILPDQHHLFDIPDDVTFLNCANMSPFLKTVNKAGIDAINLRNNPARISAKGWFNPAEELRQLFADIINANMEQTAIITSVSYGMAVAANNIVLKHGQKIIVLDQQYPSNIYAWRELANKYNAEIVTVIREKGQNWTEAIIENINENTGLVAIPNCHWTDGSIVDLVRVSIAAKLVNSRLVIDASQSLGAYPLDIEKIKPDFLLTVGYKWLLGPYGLGYLYADKQYCETGKPIEFSWLNKAGAEDFSKLVEYTDEYKPGARRFDAGGFPAFINMPMAIAALTQIKAWSVANIQETLSVLTGEIENKVKAIGLETPGRETRVGHMIGVRFPDSKKVTEVFKTLAENKIYISLRGSSLRIAPHLYNTKKDIERLFNYLKAD